MATEAAGGGRWIDVAPERLAGWLESFAQRHGEVSADAGPDPVTFRAADGAVAQCHVPFPPLADGAAGNRRAGLGAARRADRGACPRGAHGRPYCWCGSADTRPGYLPARCPSWPPRRSAPGWCTGAVPPAVPHSTASPGAARSRPPRRWARPRARPRRYSGPMRAGSMPWCSGETGGRWPVLRADSRLEPYLSLAVERFLTVPDPRLAVLRSTPRLFRAIRIRLTGPA